MPTITCSYRRPRRAVLAAAAVALSGVAGCYNPVIENGGLKCSGGGRCPSGFECASDKHCWKPGTGPVGGAGGAGGVAGAGGIGGLGGIGGMGGSVDGGACLGPVASCTPATMTGQECDPVCQHGCMCQQRCGIMAGIAKCTEPGRRKLGESCDVNQPELDCGAGLICLRDDCGSRCYRYCREDRDCLRARCALTITSMSRDTGYKACDVPNTGCNPVGTIATTACTNVGAGLGCYLIAPDETGCDCPSANPPLNEGDVCMLERDCRPGFICAPGTGGVRCRRVCDLSGVGAICGARMCKPWKPTSRRFGFCD